MASGTDRAARIEKVSTPDGPFDLTVWLPEAGQGPGILLIQEIFGVGEYIRAVAEDLAALGYVVAAPDLFWRLKPGHQAVHDEQGIAESLDLGSRYDTGQGVTDAAAALERLAALPEVRGGLGILGFCLGGSIAYFLAARTRPDAVVSFYGSAVPDHTDVLAHISAPIQFHFGGNDPYIPRDQVALVEAAVRDTQNAEVHVEEDAGHAFHNRKAPMFHHPEPAARAWQRTEEFLARHLPVRRLTNLRSATVVTGTTPAAKAERPLRLSRWIRAPRRIQCIQIPPIHHQARIHHRNAPANPANPGARTLNRARRCR